MAVAPRWECNKCKNRLQRARCVPDTDELLAQISTLTQGKEAVEEKLELKTREMEELHRDFVKLSKDHAELSISYKNLLETSLSTQMEKSLVITSPIFCPDCKKRRRKASGRPPKDPCDCVLP